jgi:heme A synthase
MSMSNRSRMAAFGSAGFLILAGVATALIVAGGLGQPLGLALIGLGFVLVTSLVFLEVGLSEDRERAREHRNPKRSQAGRRRPRLARSRGRPRRLR